MKQTKIERIKELLNSSIETVRKTLKNEYMLEWNSGYFQGLKHALFVVELVEGKKLIDTNTEYGYINIEKNGKKGHIIL